VLAAPAAAVRDAERRAACFSPLGAALVLAASAAAMRDTVRRAPRLNPLGAALVLAMFSSGMRPAVWSATALSRLGAALVLTPFAPAMRHAVRRAATNSPPAHTAACPWHSSRLTPRWRRRNLSRATYRSVSLRSVWSVLLQGRRLTRWAFFRRSRVQRSAQCSQSLSRNHLR
jgi:hypothetical protein